MGAIYHNMTGGRTDGAFACLRHGNHVLLPHVIRYHNFLQPTRALHEPTCVVRMPQKSLERHCPPKLGTLFDPDSTGSLVL